MSSLYYYWNYLGHLLTANTRHGTHSPFVYRLVNEVFYVKRQADEPRDKVLRLISRLIIRFGPRQIYHLGAKLPDGRLDFVLVRGSEAERINDNLIQCWAQLHAGSVLVVEGIYRNGRMKRLWQSIQDKPEVTITIDLFHVGLVFFHAGQAKAHFRIRY